ncbi:MAG: alpha/beta hydrolase [bacterium]
MNKGKVSSCAPLLFLHGWGTTSKIWQRQKAHFSPSWPVLVPDYLIRNTSLSLFSAPLTLENLVDGVFTLCRHCSLPPIHLIGWSLGSLIAMEFTSRFAPQVASLTLVAGTPKFTSDESFHDGIAKGESRLLRSRLQRDRLLAFSSFHQFLFTDQEKTQALALNIRELLRTDREIPDQTLLEGLNILEEADLRPVLSTLKVPVLIVHGDSDRLCPVGAARYLHQHIPHSRLEIFPDCGHLPFLTREGMFNQILENFLKLSER